MFPLGGFVIATDPTGAAPESSLPASSLRKSAEHVGSARQFAIDAARMALNTHCRNIVVMDVGGLSPITDFFVIATGTSPRQMRSVCDDIEQLGAPQGHRAKSRSGYEGDHWICVDFVDVVVHMFNEESRMFYDLDNLWGDARRVEWRDPKQPPPPTEDNDDA